MKNDITISSLACLGKFLENFINTEEKNFTEEQQKFSALIRRSEIENPWFNRENVFFCLKQWAKVLTEENIVSWISSYEFSSSFEKKKIGLILAGNIPLVGFHDVISVILSGNYPIIKLSSKDRLLIPFLMEQWNDFAEGALQFNFVEKLENYEAVIATGSNNTARYLGYYFKDVPNIIRKNRTSIAVLKGDETDVELQLLAEDIFRYFGLGCRNVTRLFIPENMPLDRFFENFTHFKEVINHHKYANNYDYNRAIYLLNQEKFWDNNFIMLKEDEKLFSPLAVLNFSRYKNISEVEKFISEHKQGIQCIVAKSELNITDSIAFGQAQCPALNTYADGVDTMEFISEI